MKVLLGVTGGIAAYKSPELVRRLADHGVEIQVVMTASAQEFVKPLVFQAVSGSAVHLDLLDEQAEAGMGHIELARWADLVLIAPATANTMAKLAAGLADDLLTTVCLATQSKLAIAPAMNSVMWQHPATRENTRVLRERGVEILGPGVGSQACGETGAGRMLEPLEIVEGVLALQKQTGLGKSGFISDASRAVGSLSGINVLITAGPTREDIDPVRFISNHSSGKMGFALSRAAQDAGANVTLIAGPVRLHTPEQIDRVDVISARQMQAAVMERAAANDIFISVAAVADYRIKKQHSSKIKKTDDDLTLTLVRNPDILSAVAALANKPFCVGFAAETEQLEKYARGKLQKKNLDMIIGNLVGGTETGFNSEKNAVEVYWADGKESFPIQPKENLAKKLIELLSIQYVGSGNDK